MRTFLTSLFACILTLMIGVTTWVFDACNLFADRWFVATFCDAYCGFVAFYVWVAYRESNLVARLIWFVAIMALGNIAVAIYAIIAIQRLEPSESWDRLFLRRAVSGTQ